MGTSWISRKGGILGKKSGGGINPLTKYVFDISELFIQCNTDSCCEHISGGAYICLYRCVSLLTPVCALCLSVFVCGCVCVWYQIRVLAKTTLCARPQ